MSTIDSEAVGRAVADGMRAVLEEFFPRGNQADFGKSSVGNDFPTISQTHNPVATPSKLELAKQWLGDHPEHLGKAGRDLESAVAPQGVKISYRTWNDAKKALGNHD